LDPSNVVINANPGTEVCTGTNVTLTANAFEAVSYTWSTGETGPTIIVTETEAGTVDYICTVVNEDGCESEGSISIDYIAASEITITVDPEEGPYCLNDPVVLEAFALDALSYTWQPGGLNDPIITVTSDVYGIVEYEVTVLNELGCETTASVEIDYDCVTAVAEIETDKMTINVYPNPNKGEFNIELIGINQEVEISIIDFAGRLIVEEKILDITEDKMIKHFNLNEYERGVYFLQITHGETVSYQKVVIH
ncbi:MAG: T9SS type A sorting domain-containing protein, partial [Bacteroidales bacterium]|nr:T9SS type A sorting domain-containing protein [Bacteroidales bacterium]